MTIGTAITSASLLLQAGSIVRGILSLPTARVCQVPRDITFGHARSFVEPTAENKLAFQTLIARLNIEGKQRLLLITGHTDSTGKDEINDPLSARRARAVKAVLLDDTKDWERLFSIDEGWGSPELKMILTELGETDASGFFGSANAAKREALFKRYFAKLLGGSVVPAFAPTTPDMMSCGKRQLLHGDPLNPSRDVSKPPILGDHRASRRSEFFSFDKTAPPPIACDEYPKWAGKCSLTRPAPRITVKITPIESVTKNKTADIQITITPAPLPVGVSINLTLSTTRGKGAARFTATNSATTTIRASGPVKVSGIVASSAADNIRLTANVIGQAGTAAQEDFTVVDAIFIHLQFEVFNLKTGAFQTLPAGINVDMMDKDPASDDLVARQPTNAAGRVFFNLPDLSQSGESDPDIFFLVHANGIKHAENTLPAKWSTSGWLAADNTTTGLQPNFIGPTLGTPSSPIVFRIGLDFHAQLKYHVDAGTRVGNDDPAPKGVLVKLMQEEIGPDRELLSLRTRENGLIDGISFDAEAGRTFYLHIQFEMQDSDINLKRTRFTTSPFIPPIADIALPAGSTLEWDTNTADGGTIQEFKSQRSTSIGTVGVGGVPAPFLCTAGNRNVALYILKVLREEAVFFFKVTQGDWKGVEVAVSPTAPVRAFSAPVNRIQLKFPDDRWDRETVAHEMAHQVMWETVNFSTLGIIYEAFVPGQDLVLNHSENLMANPEQALIEGWAEFVEAIFEGSGTPPFSVSSLIDTSSKAVTGGLGPPPKNRGELVEGALANGLWAIFENHVAARRAPLNARLPESADGDVTVTAPWIKTPDVQRRFLSAIWRPLKTLAPLPNPNSTNLLASIKTENSKTTSDNWHVLLPELEAFNMSMRVPKATAIEPHWGPITGGQPIGLSVTITGTDFIQKTTAVVDKVPAGGPFPTLVLETTVDFGGTPGTGVNVGKHTSLQVVPPPRPAGPVNVIVTTRGGSSTPPLQFVYIDDPLAVSDVAANGLRGVLVPRVVSTRGKDSFDILGQGFLPGAIVEISGVQVAPKDIKILQPDLIQVLQTPARAAGPVDILVKNPDTASSNLTGRLRFADPPEVINMLNPASRSGPANQSNNITVQGLNIQPNATLSDGLQSIPITITRSGGNVEVEFDLPAGPPGVVTLELENPNDGLSSTFDFLRQL
ncbi:MAG TPA: IPT/TIG domain-containing protein [Pyrinomonadaceae bacterium]|nr:IPT/TIG domain-containing protein [Pyrinomonadaceae bacterium]